MVETYIGDNSHQRRSYNIGGIKSTAHADLKHYDITVHLLEIQHAYGCDELKLARMILHGISCKAHSLGYAGESLLSNIFTIYLYTLSEVLDKGGRIEAGAVTRGPEYAFRHGAGAALAVCSGNMYESESLLRIAKPLKQLNSALKTKP